MKEVGLSEILSGNPELARAEEGVEQEQGVRRFVFELAKYTVQVDSKVPAVTDALAQFAWTHQILIIQGIVDRLPAIGDSMSFREDVLGSGSAHITRARARGPGIRLTIDD